MPVFHGAILNLADVHWGAAVEDLRSTLEVSEPGNSPVSGG
jgi:hypothetical protein